ncbi:MAG TPA: carbon-nitrogen hydrolase family protein [Fimbriimonas sp.]
MKIACVQCDVVFGETKANREKAVEAVEQASGSDLVVFPEAFLTGYCAGSPEEARAVAIGADNPALTELGRLAADRQIMLAVGFAELDRGALYNAVAFFDEGRPMRLYRKTHLPFLGYDRFASPGGSLPVFDTSRGKIGILVCFDLRFPEAARVLSLRGAELILLPTNWPEGAEVSADHISIARAAENRVFLAAVNRVGTEGGFRFFGRSKVIHPSGKVLASASDSESVFMCEIDLSEARIKRTVYIPGEYETEVFKVRQPLLYGELADPGFLGEPNRP